MNNLIKPIAIYLPQFHPIPENNEWWGHGFTEWTNVSKAKPLFKGHYQPHLPADLGYYDLRLDESRIAQEQLAKQYGIYGFCYYHYWFSGKRLLDEPLTRKLNNPKEDPPFMLCWANETWSRRWLGEEKEILIEQCYSSNDDRLHIQHLITIFQDKRYIRINNRPVFIIYRPTYLPDVQKTLSIFAEECLKAEMPLPYFIGSNSHAPGIDMRTFGFDDELNFQPKLGYLPQSHLDHHTIKKGIHNIKAGIISSKLKIYDYKKAKKNMDNRPLHPHLPCSLVGWDNSARRGKNGIVLKDAHPDIFAEYLQKDIDYLLSRKDDIPFLFINAWNEWAEGNHLEPDMKYGHGFLHALQKTLAPYVA